MGSKSLEEKPGPRTWRQRIEAHAPLLIGCAIGAATFSVSNWFGRGAATDQVDLAPQLFSVSTLLPMLSTASLFTGLLTAALAALIAIRSSEIVSRLRPGGHWARLVSFVRDAVLWLILLIVAGVTSLVAISVWRIDLNGQSWYPAVMVGIFAAAISATLRVILHIAEIAKLVR